MRWIGPEDDATAAGRRLGGMVYLGTETRRDTWQGDVAIDPHLPVAKVGALYAGEGMPYWPNYRAIDSRVRASYLDWLAGGRDDPRIGPGYVFLFFYGIERRFFVDNPDPREKRLLLTEVERLLLAYGEHHSGLRYVDAFVEAARIAIDPSGNQEPCLGKPGYDLPLGLRVAIFVLPLFAGFLHHDVNDSARQPESATVEFVQNRPDSIDQPILLRREQNPRNADYGDSQLLRVRPA